MSADGPAIDRLRASLRAAAIPVTDADLERVSADGYLDWVARVRAVLASVDGEAEPDYLAAWAAEGVPDSAAAGRDVRNEAASRSGVESSRAPSAAAGGGSPRAADAAPSRYEAHHPGPKGTDLPATLTGVACLLRDRQLSPVELAERSLACIEVRDPQVNAFQLLTVERALAAARRAEAEIARGEYRGPLHGVPVAAKDLLAMRGTVTTAGSKVRSAHVTGYDAHAVERLEVAGAVIVGKTRLSEFAYWPGSTNPHYGPTRNPRDLSRDTGGSSSGSAAAVADGWVWAAMGSDTGGSIRIPAALCGVVGLKPTYGRVSLFGCAPLSWSLDHLGPLTPCVGDAGLVLAALAGHDARDPRTSTGAAFSTPLDLEAGAAGLRIGVPTTDGSGEPFGTDAAVAAWDASNRALAAAGATLIEIDLREMTALRMLSGLILAVEAAALHAPTLRTRYSDYGAFCRGRLLGAHAYSAEDFIQAQRLRRNIRATWDEMWTRIDLISTPAQPDVAPPLDEPASTRFTNAFNALGWPAITVPFGRGEGGLPLATQLVARPWQEGTLLRGARALEHASGART